MLEDTLTPAERNLAEMGEHERLRETRMFFQYARVREFCEPVERLTGRKVRARERVRLGVRRARRGEVRAAPARHPEPSRIDIGNELSARSGGDGRAAIDAHAAVGAARTPAVGVTRLRRSRRPRRMRS